MTGAFALKKQLRRAEAALKAARLFPPVNERQVAAAIADSAADEGAESAAVGRWRAEVERARAAVEAAEAERAGDAAVRDARSRPHDVVRQLMQDERDRRGEEVAQLEANKEERAAAAARAAAVEAEQFRVAVASPLKQLRMWRLKGALVRSRCATTTDLGCELMAAANEELVTYVTGLRHITHLRRQGSEGVSQTSYFQRRCSRNLSPRGLRKHPCRSGRRCHPY